VVIASVCRNNPNAEFSTMSVIGASDLIGRAPGGRKLIAVVYADMVGYSRLIGLDDMGTLERLRTLRSTLIDPAISEHGGRTVQTGGDSLLIVFDSIDGAVRCAVEMQQRAPDYDGDQPPDRAIRFRVGINIGDVIADGTDLHGDGVNVAARLQAECPPGGICVSRAVRDHVHDRLDLVFDELGALSLKNITRPVEAFLLRSGPEGAEPRLLSSASLPHLNVKKTKLQRLSVMVATLRNLGAPEEHERLVEGVIEDIAAYLARWRVSVVGSDEAPFHIGDSLNPRNTLRASEFGVGYLIQGSIRGAAEQIEVNLQLIEVEIGVHVWSERFSIDLGDTRDERNETSRRVASTILMKLSEDVNHRIEVFPPQEWTSSDLLHRGQALLVRPIGTGTLREAIKSFEQALVGEPTSVDARLGIARALIIDIADRLNGSTGQDEVRAELLLLDLLRVNANLPVTHSLMGVLRRVQGRLTDSRIELEIAIELSPSYSNAIAQLGLTLASLGDPERGIPLIERSLRLSPHDFSAPAYRGCLGLCHLLLGNNDEALTSLRAARAFNPLMHYIHWGLAAALGLRGELDEARVALRQAIEMRPEIASPPGCYVISRRPSPAFVALYEKTVFAGLRQAGLPNVWDQWQSCAGSLGARS
jgi:adenylate cyclase